MANDDDELKGLLDSLKKTTEFRSDERQQAVKEEDAWVNRFNELKNKVIRPTMQALGEKIRKQDHDFNIIETPFLRENRAIPEEATIRMDLYLANERTRTMIGRDRRPHLAFVTHHRSERVHVILCDITAKGGVISKVGEYPLESVNDFLVREKFMALVKRLISQEGPLA